MKKMRAKIEQGDDRRARIWLDDVELTFIKGFELSGQAGGDPILTVTLIVQAVNQDEIETTPREAAKPGE